MRKTTVPRVEWEETEAGRIVLRLWLERWWDGDGFKGIFRKGIRRSRCVHLLFPLMLPEGVEPKAQCMTGTQVTPVELENLS